MESPTEARRGAAAAITTLTGTPAAMTQSNRERAEVVGRDFDAGKRDEARTPRLRYDVTAVPCSSP
jgi:hypothetical protein